MTATARERLDEIAGYVGCHRMLKESDHDFARRLLIAIKEHVELFTYLHTETIAVLGEDGVRAAEIESELLEYVATFTSENADA